MIQSFGHLSRVLGVRVVPDQWHRSQRVDVGFGRRARLFVADGGERLARVFFTPELVQLFRRVGRSYDIEIKDQFLYLFSSRSVAAGGEDRWNGQRQLVDALAASMSDAGVWDHLRRQGLGQKDRFGEIRADVTRALAIVIGVMVVVVVVLSVLALRALGLLG